MPLTVYTSDLHHRGEDTLKVYPWGQASAAPWVPTDRTWSMLLNPMQRLNDARREAALELSCARELLRAGERTASQLWLRPRMLYVEELRASYRRHSDAWRALLERDVVTLQCSCSAPEHCHRTLLAAVLLRLGARYGGERGPLGWFASARHLRVPPPRARR